MGGKPPTMSFTSFITFHQNCLQTQSQEGKFSKKFLRVVPPRKFPSPSSKSMLCVACNFMQVRPMLSMPTSSPAATYDNFHDKL